MKNVKFRGKDEFRGEIPRLKFRGKNPNSAVRLESSRGPRKTVGPILMMQSLIHVGLPCLDPGASIPNDAYCKFPPICTKFINFPPFSSKFPSIFIQCTFVLLPPILIMMHHALHVLDATA